LTVLSPSSNACERSLVWRQAENRMHAQNGLLVELLG